jgi:hypothetical protein
MPTFGFDPIFTGSPSAIASLSTDLTGTIPSIDKFSLPTSSNIVDTNNLLNPSAAPTSFAPELKQALQQSPIGSKALTTLNPTLFSDVNEITLNNSLYYANNQPMLARVVIDFTPQGNVGVETTFGQLSPSVINQIASNIPVASTVLESVPSLFTGTGIEDRPQRLISFEYNRITNGVGSFTLTLFDSTWQEIETKLVQAKGVFKFQYGYSDGTENTISPWYNAKAIQYKIDFFLQGVILTISGLTLGWKMNLAKKYDAFSSYKISEIVKELATDAGITDTEIEETQDVLVPDAMEVVDQIPKNFQLTAQTPLSFVIQKLIPYAKNKEGQGNYVFFFDVTSDGKEVLHFHTIYYAFAAKTGQSVFQQASTFQKTLQTAGIGSTPGFTLFKDKNSPVRNYQPDWRMSTVQLCGGGRVFNSIMDANTKQILNIKADLDENNNVLQLTDNKPNIVQENIKDYVSSSEKDTSAFYINTRNTSRHGFELKAKTDADFSRRIIGAMKAHLEIVGTPKFKCCDKIAVLIYVPGDNILSTQKNVHWISGYFRIIKIIEHISAGTYTTTFELVTDTRGQVVNQPVKMEQTK